MVSSTFDNRRSGRSRRAQKGDCVHVFHVPGPPKPPVSPPLSSLPLYTGCIRFAKTEMHLSAKRGMFLTQGLWPGSEKISGNFLRFSGAEAVFVARFIFGRLFAIWRESQRPLLARRRASRRPIWPARESCRRGPMLVTIPPARSGPPDRIGAASGGSMTDVGVGPGWRRRGETRAETDRTDRRVGRVGDPSRSANRRSGWSCSRPTRPSGATTVNSSRCRVRQSPTRHRARPPASEPLTTCR